MRAKTVIAIKCKYLRFWDINRLDLFVFITDTNIVPEIIKLLFISRKKYYISI